MFINIQAILKNAKLREQSRLSNRTEFPGCCLGFASLRNEEIKWKHSRILLNEEDNSFLSQKLRILLKKCIVDIKINQILQKKKLPQKYLSSKSNFIGYFNNVRFSPFYYAQFSNYLFQYSANKRAGMRYSGSAIERYQEIVSILCNSEI